MMNELRKHLENLSASNEIFAKSLTPAINKVLDADKALQNAIWEWARKKSAAGVPRAPETVPDP